MFPLTRVPLWYRFLSHSHMSSAASGFAFPVFPPMQASSGAKGLQGLTALS